MNITNKCKRPISISLPGGKKLFLGPGKSGQINHLDTNEDRETSGSAEPETEIEVHAEHEDKNDGR